MEKIPEDSLEHDILMQYIENTADNFDNLEITNIYRLERSGEAEKFNESSTNLDNHLLLWHGSHLSNFVGILKQVCII